MMVSEASTPSRMRRVVFALLITTIVVFTFLDALVFRQVVPHIPHFVSKKLQDISAIPSSSLPNSYYSYNQSYGYFANSSSTDFKVSTNAAPDFSTTQEKLSDIRTLANKKTALREKLKKLGYEPAEDHEFKSQYIITPKIYDKTSGTVSKNPAQKTKVISCFNCPNWFIKSDLNHYNRDFKACPRPCIFDMAGKYETTADALLFFVGQIGSKPKPSRPSGQIWIAAYWEAPVHYGYPKIYEPWKNVFNWTFHYRADSDIFAPNNILAWRNRDELLSDNEYMEIAKKKKKTVAWWVSNCHTNSQREKYVTEMKKYVDVDIYGKCGPLNCLKTKYDECEQMLTTTYKFYLSFENALCKDYVSEKFFRNFAYRTHIVPVGRAGFDYDKFIPPGSFVNAAKFKTAKDLALHLKELGNDLPTYANMLKEKDKLVALNRKFDWCDICEKLHTDKSSKNIPDIKAWSHLDTCIKPTDIS